MEVVVRADLFNTGLFLEAQHLHLGSNDCTAFPSAEAELTVHFNLMECGMKLSVSDGSRLSLFISQEFPVVRKLSSSSFLFNHVRFKK